jgi:hypothetical protein
MTRDCLDGQNRTIILAILNLERSLKAKQDEREMEERERQQREHEQRELEQRRQDLQELQVQAHWQEMHEFQEREEQEERRAASAPADGPRGTAGPLPSATVGPGGQLLQGEQQEQMEERPLPSATVGPGGQLLQGEQQEQMEERRAARAPADGPRGTAGPLPSATVGPGGQFIQSTMDDTMGTEVSSASSLASTLPEPAAKEEEVSWSWRWRGSRRGSAARPAPAARRGAPSASPPHIPRRRDWPWGSACSTACSGTI